MVSCDVLIPEPPEGQSLEPGKVAAEVTTADGNSLELPFDPGCVSGNGFEYDSLEAPTAIHLCDAACSELRRSGASVNVLFGCLFEPPELK